MGEDPTTIRREIEDTRTEMGDTVEALGYKADVKTRVKNDVSARRRRVVDRIKEPFVGAAERLPDADEVTSSASETASQAVGMVKENPIGLVVGATAVGFIAGLATPITRME